MIFLLQKELDLNMALQTLYYNVIDFGSVDVTISRQISLFTRQ